MLLPKEDDATIEGINDGSDDDDDTVDLLGLVHTSHWSEDIWFRRLQAEQVQEEDMVKDSSMKETQNPNPNPRQKVKKSVCMQAGIERNGVLLQKMVLSQE